MLVVAGCCYLGIVTARQGPPPNGDTVPLTAVTTALADGDLRAAASVASLPNPPGYALLTAPLVASAPSLVGAPTWCTTASRARADSTDRGAHPCGQGGGPPWYRSQAVLGVASWLVLALGGLALLRAAGADSLPRQAALLAFLAFLPAASSAIVQLYHPQDMVGLGLALAALSQTLRHRWILAGVLFGIALLCKQFSVLLLLPALAAAPASRSRIRLGGTAALVVAAGMLPFLAVAPRTTLDNLSGFGSGGAVSGLTVLTLAGVTGGIASAVARDAPVVFALVVCLWAARRPVGRPAGRSAWWPWLWSAPAAGSSSSRWCSPTTCWRRASSSCCSTWWHGARRTVRWPGARPRPSSSPSGRPATRWPPSARSSWR